MTNFWIANVFAGGVCVGIAAMLARRGNRALACANVVAVAINAAAIAVHFA